MASYTGGENVIKLVRKFNIANVLGYTENVDEDLAAVYSTNPA